MFSQPGCVSFSTSSIQLVELYFPKEQDIDVKKWRRYSKCFLFPKNISADLSLGHRDGVECS